MLGYFRVLLLCFFFKTLPANTQTLETKLCFPSQSVYLHTDQESYFRDDTVWFKAFCVSRSAHDFGQSKLLFVELVDVSTQRILLSKKILLANEVGHGELALPDSLSKQFYQIRAYTNQMRVQSAGLIFQKNIFILNNQPPIAEAVLAASDSVDIQFLPEGGHLVAELPNRVAFKAINKHGYGVPISGTLIDSQAKVITAIYTEHLGMGAFYFTPKTGENYRVKVESNGLRAKYYKIPAPQPNGFTMQINNLRKDEVWVIINNNLPLQPDHTLTLVAQNNGEIRFVGKEDANKKSIKFVIPRQKLGTGIVALTLLNDAQSVVCERIIMGNLPALIPVSVQTPLQKYKPNEQVNLTLTLGDSLAVFDENTQLSASVVDANQTFAEDDALSLLSYHVLQPVLKGYIEKPNYYFDPKNQNAKLHLDLLLMTQGWRQFDWQNKPKCDSLPLRQNDLSVSGKVTFDGKVINKPLLLMTIAVGSDSTQRLFTTQTDETGRFVWENILQNNAVKVYAKPINSKLNTKFFISIDSLPVPKIDQASVPLPFFADKQLLGNVTSNWTATKRTMEGSVPQQPEQYLREVVVKAKRLDNDPRRMMYGTPDASLSFDNQNTAGASTVFDVMNGRLAGVRMVNTGSAFSNNLDSDDFSGLKVQIRGATDALGNPIEPLFLLDGVPVRKGVCSVIPASSVEAVDVLKNAAASIYGTRAAGGVINILTKTGGKSDGQYQNLKENAQMIKLLGYDTAKVFYQPRFEPQETKNKPKDLRRTLLWATNLTISPNKTFQLSFRNSNIGDRILLKIEGLTPNGQLISHAQLLNLR